MNLDGYFAGKIPFTKPCVLKKNISRSNAFVFRDRLTDNSAPNTYTYY